MELSLQGFELDYPAMTTKVLFINKFLKPDYLNDCLFHGFSKLDLELEVTNKPSYMLKSFPRLRSLYGKGFTVYGLLNSFGKVEPNPQEKIKDKYYDIIIYGSLHRDRSYSDIVLNYYSRDKILSFDGEDHLKIYEPFVNSTVYFKRENANNRQDVKPISFSIPEEKIITKSINKNKLFAKVIPGDLSTYIFDEEKDYYQDYGCSFYGHTWKKGGWDCMRHYEILAAGCIPCFRDLDKCPKGIMKNFPKDLILKMNKYSQKGEIPSNYYDVQEELITYTKNNLTTKQTCKKILQ